MQITNIDLTSKQNETTKTKEEEKINSNFSDMLGEARNKKENEETQKTNEVKETQEEELARKKEEEKSIDELVADILSLIRTGLTVKELEALQELLSQITKKIKDYHESEPKKNEDLQEIKDLINELREMLYNFKKKAKMTININEEEINSLIKSIHSLSNVKTIEKLNTTFNEIQEEIKDRKEKESLNNKGFNSHEILAGIQEIKSS